MDFKNMTSEAALQGFGSGFDCSTCTLAHVADKIGLDEETAEKMYNAGVSGIYHALRLREGIDTDFDPQVRKNTMRAVADSSLKLISLVEPVGPEHSNEELADAFLVTLEYGAAIPRDEHVSTAEWLGYTAADARRMMEEAGYTVLMKQ